MPRQQRAGILDSRASLVGGFQQIAGLTGNIPAGGHAEQMFDRNVDVSGEESADQKRAEKARDGSFPRLFRTEDGSEFVLADGAPYEIGGGVANPGDDKNEEQKVRTEKAEGVKTNRERKRKSDQNQRAGADACGGQCFDHRTVRPQRQDCDAEQEDEEHITGVRRGKK